MQEVFRGQIYFAQVPSTWGSAQAGYRPVIVVSNNIANRYSAVVTVVPVTSKEKKDLPTHFQVRAGKVQGTALCEQVITISKELLASYSGTLSQKEVMELNCSLVSALALPIETETIRAFSVAQQVNTCQELRTQLEQAIAVLEEMTSGAEDEKQPEAVEEQPVKRAYNRRTEQQIRQFVSDWRSVYDKAQRKKLAEDFGFSSVAQAAQFYKRWESKI